MIELDNISAFLGTEKILDNLSLTINDGESLVITGPSGCGKSSLLKLLLGGLAWQSGEYHFRGEPVIPTLLTTIRTQCGYIGQESALGQFTVRQVFERPFQFAAYKDKQLSEERLHALLVRLKLDSNILDKSIQNLSGGQRQRINIIRTLLLEPTTLIADEPTSALDDESAQAVADLILSDNSGFCPATVISVSHDSRWINCCARHMVMVNGRVTEHTAEQEKLHVIYS